MTWRRCSEEMPTPSVDVWVWTKYGNSYIAFLDWRGDWREAETGASITGITHWQPITPPDEGAAREGEGE